MELKRGLRRGITGCGPGCFVDFVRFVTVNIWIGVDSGLYWWMC